EISELVDGHTIGFEGKDIKRFSFQLLQELFTSYAQGDMRIEVFSAPLGDIAVNVINQLFQYMRIFRCRDIGRWRSAALGKRSHRINDLLLQAQQLLSRLDDNSCQSQRHPLFRKRNVV